MSYYQQKIVEILGVSKEDAIYIEDIMRNDIFHSTLDWQTKKQFIAGAREAHTLLKECRKDPELSNMFK